MNELFLDGESLTFEQVLAVAEGAPGAPIVLLSEEALEKVTRSATAVERLLERGEVAYGITTGFGAFKDKIISRDQVEVLQENIVKSHAVGVGEPLDEVQTRAVMLIRANTLARGFSGIRLETLQLLLDLLNSGIHPVIPSQGSLGASGDLAPLAHMALPLIGEGEVFVGNERVPSKKALERSRLEPVKLAAKEGLALTNGTSVMTALGLLQTARAKWLADAADVAGCLSLEALNGTTAAFDERIHELRPHPRQVECAANLRRILEGSEFTRGHDPANIQDAYTLRCIPQVHGACRDAIAYAEWVVNIELNAVTDNPLIFADEDTDEIEVISGGNFHGEPLAIAMDYLAIALSELGNISERRIMRLTDEDSNAHILPAFLTENGGLNSGFMIVQYTAAALATENKVLSHPASVDTIPSSANVEDHVSMGVTSALKLCRISTNLERILSLEMLSAAQAIDLRRHRDPDVGKMAQETETVYKKIREKVPFIENDEVMYPHIENVIEILGDHFGGPR
ncbi:MAG: histidine ammonia-lyase [Acidobacteria bacterium]|nr:MAG: histidine ammonia-lyase [Acidobacteriota bacterium]REK01587.1 MAG: histidine ammonia-lyase [Acidobacteriota bacterium]REK14543.1 MAG: histidine ammonia-lyase [Acidobacteriota bacterium]REK45258.1 MAG: histidine ammonia-lyase [Acidobacteriota bacterium]